jgi:CDP-diacylglycerol--glycerol-3-phosphate 3-phosphatidyltransferase
LQTLSWQQKLPLWITYSRIAAVPLLLYFLYPNQLNMNVAAAILFIIASASDYFDGYFARKFNAVSVMGQFMDPIADKILVTSALVILIPSGKIDAMMVIIILARDTFIGGLRSVAAAEQIIIAAKPQGKWKTALQMGAIPAVMIGETWLTIPFEKVGYWILWISVILSITSGVEYYVSYLKSRSRAKKAQK